MNNTPIGSIEFILSITKDRVTFKLSTSSKEDIIFWPGSIGTHETKLDPLFGIEKMINEIQIYKTA